MDQIWWRTFYHKRLLCRNKPAGRCFLRVITLSPPPPPPPPCSHFPSVHCYEIILPTLIFSHTTCVRDVMKWGVGLDESPDDYSKISKVTSCKQSIFFFLFFFNAVNFGSHCDVSDGEVQYGLTAEEVGMNEVQPSDVRAGNYLWLRERTHSTEWDCDFDVQTLTDVFSVLFFLFVSNQNLCHRWKTLTIMKSQVLGDCFWFRSVTDGESDCEPNSDFGCLY